MIVVDVGLVYDLRVPFADSADRHRQYRAMLDQVAWADGSGFSRVSVREHHGAEDGYLPSPLVAAAGIAAVTSRATLLLHALVVTLHDPVRLAEDIAVLDLMSAGRVVVVAAAGYSEAEFAMSSLRGSDRPRLVTRAVKVMRQAWSGRAFELDGRSVRVTPRPFQEPGPPLLLGGASDAAARRAARIADGFMPVRNRYYKAYQAAVVAAGRPAPADLPRAGPSFLYVAEDPERAWSRIAPYCLHDSNAYGALARQSGTTTGYVEHDSTESLRVGGGYHVVTPDQAVVLCEQMGPRGQLTIAPLAGGMDPDLAWESLQLLADRVMPRVGLTLLGTDSYRHASP